LEVWAEIGRDPGSANVDLMIPVAGEPALQADKDGWVEWLSNGWHLVGTPEFTATDSSRGRTDSQGEQYHVIGCYRHQNSNLVDAQGELVYTDLHAELLMDYLVLLKASGQYYVVQKTILETSC
jgi:hypothetical protein